MALALILYRYMSRRVMESSSLGHGAHDPERLVLPETWTKCQEELHPRAEPGPKREICYRQKTQKGRAVCARQHWTCHCRIWRLPCWVSALFGFSVSLTMASVPLFRNGDDHSVAPYITSVISAFRFYRRVHFRGPLKSQKTFGLGNCERQWDLLRLD